MAFWRICEENLKVPWWHFEAFLKEPWWILEGLLLEWLGNVDDFWGVPQNVFAHTLHYMAPFAIPNTGFCMVFQRASFVFFMPRGGILSPGSYFLISGRHFGPGTFLGSKMGPEKSEFATESFCHGSSGENPKPKWIILYIGPIWAGYFAKNLGFLLIFKGCTIFQENWGTPQPVTWAIAYSPCGPLPIPLVGHWLQGE